MPEDTRSNATKRIARRVDQGEALGWIKLKKIKSVYSKVEAIAHLESKYIDTELLKQMEGNQARKAIGKIAGDSGYIYPNYRPL